VSSPAGTASKAAPTPERKHPWIVFAVLAVGAASGGGWLWWQSQQGEQPHKAPAAQRAPAQYYALEPAFVVNLVDTDAVRYLQADVQLVMRDPETRAAIEQNAPAIRNRLLLLFGQQSAQQLAQRSGKEKLQASALAEVRQVLRREAAPDRVEAVIFTSLVTQ
jgi:flagellar protein FliL